MRKVEGSGQSLAAGGAAVSRASVWAASLVSIVGALGCGSPFMGLAAPDDTPEHDAAADDGGVLDAAQTAPDATRDAPSGGGADHELKDATRDESKAPDGATATDAHHDGPLDATRRNDAGDGAPPDNGADGSPVPDANDAGHSAPDVSVDGKGSDAPFDGSTADARIDASTDTSTDPLDDADIDTPTADRDVATDADADGPVCGFAPPAPGGTCPAVCNEGCIAGVCQIACRGDQECKGVTLQCPVGFTCELICSGKQSCDATVVVCPDTYACRLLCAGEQSCKALEFNCGSGPCQLTCQGNSQACDSTVVNCGAEACTASCTSPDNPPTLNCGQSCDCRPCP